MKIDKFNSVYADGRYRGFVRRASGTTWRGTRVRKGQIPFEYGPFATRLRAAAWVIEGEARTRIGPDDI